MAKENLTVVGIHRPEYKKISQALRGLLSAMDSAADRDDAELYEKYMLAFGAELRAHDDAVRARLYSGNPALG